MKDSGYDYSLLWFSLIPAGLAGIAIQYDYYAIACVCLTLTGFFIGKFHSSKYIRPS